ncbi:cytochrome B6, partial [Salmonella enterica subsp. enterica serovar Javiana]
YVSSWIYVFGVLTIASLVVVVGTGCVLAVGGAAWWHVSSLGHYVNSLHLWSVELFFGFMVIHLWGKFWMAAWRGRRLLTWVTGVVAFVTSIGTAFTGYLSQSNFDSQWISAEAKDGINSIGVGAWFNVLNPGQMLLWHVVLL